MALGEPQRRCAYQLVRLAPSEPTSDRTARTIAIAGERARPSLPNRHISCRKRVVRRLVFSEFVVQPARPLALPSEIQDEYTPT